MSQLSLRRWMDLEGDVEVIFWFQPFGHLWHSVEISGFPLVYFHNDFIFRKECTTHNISKSRSVIS